MVFCFLGVGECPKVNKSAPGLGLFPMPPGGEEKAQGRLLCLLPLTYSSCWSLTGLHASSQVRQDAPALEPDIVCFFTLNLCP